MKADVIHFEFISLVTKFQTHQRAAVDDIECRRFESRP